MQQADAAACSTWDVACATSARSLGGGIGGLLVVKICSARDCRRGRALGTDLLLYRPVGVHGAVADPRGSATET